jgi:hypothetical protein
MNRKELAKAIAPHPEHGWDIRDTFIADSVEKLSPTQLTKLATQLEKLGDSIKPHLNQEKSNAYAVAGSFYFMAEKTNEAIEALKKGLKLEEPTKLTRLVMQAVQTIPDPEFWKDSFLRIEKVYI